MKSTISPEPQQFARKATIRVQSSAHGARTSRKSSLCLATVAVRLDTTREKPQSKQRPIFNSTVNLSGSQRSYETALLRTRAPSRLRAPPASAMAVAATIPAYFELVMAVVVASYLVHSVYMSLAVGKARRTYGVAYPDMYATKDNCANEEDAKTFNCIQRAHQNSLEVLPIFLTLLLCAGLKHPITASITGVAFLAARVVYFTGYSTGVPGNRVKGFLVAFLLLFGLAGIVVKSVVVWGLSLAA